MSKIRTSRTRPEERAITIKRFRSSGLTQKAFCKVEGVSVSTLQNWLRTNDRSRAFSEVVPSRPPATTVELLFPDGTALRIRSE